MHWFGCRLVMKARSMILLALLCVMLSFPPAWSGEMRSGEMGRNANTIAVRGVNDGDTISALVGDHFDKIRLIGIECPRDRPGAVGEDRKETSEGNDRLVFLEGGDRINATSTEDCLYIFARRTAGW
jgi:endonuclease YncB( thermonuclease family)